MGWSACAWRRSLHVSTAARTAALRRRDTVSAAKADLDKSMRSRTNKRISWISTNRPTCSSKSATPAGAAIVCRECDVPGRVRPSCLSCREHLADDAAAVARGRRDRPDPPLTSICRRGTCRIDTNFYPLGSCTMKYNPKRHERLAALPGLADLHPLQTDDAMPGHARKSSGRCRTSSPRSPA